jgi:hypothetical protein
LRRRIGGRVSLQCGLLRKHPLRSLDRLLSVRTLDAHGEIFIRSTRPTVSESTVLDRVGTEIPEDHAPTIPDGLNMSEVFLMHIRNAFLGLQLSNPNVVGSLPTLERNLTDSTTIDVQGKAIAAGGRKRDVPQPKGKCVETREATAARDRIDREAYLLDRGQQIAMRIPDSHSELV